eukprot:6479990-Amphidinium_carterae.1
MPVSVTLRACCTSSIMDTSALTASKGGVAEKRSHPAEVSAGIFLALMSLHTKRDLILVLVGSPPPLSVSIHLRSSGRPVHWLLNSSLRAASTASYDNHPPWTSSQNSKSPSGRSNLISSSATAHPWHKEICDSTLSGWTAPATELSRQVAAMPALTGSRVKQYRSLNCDEDSILSRLTRECPSHGLTDEGA